MIIIIEGPDGSGKSTLAETISKQTGWPIEHRSKPETEEEKQKMYSDYWQLCRGTRNVILDRCWYSEFVYGSVMRDQSVMSYNEMYELERALTKGGAMVIYCTDKEAALWHRATTRGEDYITCRNDFKRICEEYDKIMNMPHYIPVVRYTVPSPAPCM